MAVNGVKVTGLSWTYGGDPVLDAICTGFSPGKLNCVIGPNGSGKTTLLKCLLGLLAVPEKTVFYNDTDLHSYSRKELARIAAYVPQNPGVQFDYTVREIVESGRYPYLHRFRDMQPTDRAIVDKVMERAEISLFSDKAVTSLSGGEAQRVYIARALAQGPSIVFLDEPTAHLDIHHRISIFRLLKKLVQTEGLTVIAVLHDLDFVFAYADYVVVIDRAALVASGKPEEVITAELCRSVFGIDAELGRDKSTGKPFVIPRFLDG
ncbi:MAG: ABC transporter ATP-binding protein [Spirochaetales bacterium]|nr:ABC transporter ATP-binding protein [Spirochaetales bacterium]